MKTAELIVRDIGAPPTLVAARHDRRWLPVGIATACAWAAACVVLVTCAILFVDRPVARLMHDMFRHGPAATALARLPETSTLVPGLIVVVAGACMACGMRIRAVLRIGGAALASFGASETLKSGLKFVFGRTWPETWVHSNPSYIRDGVFGFFPFHGGSAYAAFPSGHMTAAASVMTVAWVLLPRGRPVWALTMLLSAGGLLAMNYHYVGDVIAGFFLGSSVSVLVVGLARRLAIVPYAPVAPGGRP